MPEKRMSGQGAVRAFQPQSPERMRRHRYAEADNERNRYWETLDKFGYNFVPKLTVCQITNISITN